MGWKNVKFTDSQFLDIIQQESLDTKDEADGKYVCGITLRTDEIDDYEILKDLGNSEQLELKMVLLRMVWPIILKTFLMSMVILDLESYID